MRELTIDEISNVEGGWIKEVVVAIVGAIVGAVTGKAMEDSEKGPSATLSNGTVIQCQPGQHLEVNGNSAKCD